MKPVSTILLLGFMACTVHAQSKLIDSLQNIVALQKRDTVELRALSGLSLEFLRRDLTKSKQYAHQLVAQAKAQEAVWQLGDGYYFLILAHQNSGNPDSAVFYLELLRKHAEANPTRPRIAYNFNQAAGLFYKNTGQPKKALSYIIKNLDYQKTENNDRAGLLLNIGNIYFDLGEYRNSVTKHLEALRIFEKTGNVRGQSFCLQNLGNNYFELKQFALAKTYYQASLEKKQQQKDQRGLVTSNLSLGHVYKELAQFENSEKSYRQSLGLAVELKLPVGEAKALHALGLLYKEQGKMTAAKESLEAGLRAVRKTGDSLTSTKIASDLIGLDLQIRRNQQAESALLKNLNTFVSLGDRNAEGQEYGRLSDYYASQQEFEKAYHYQKKYEALMDTLKGRAVTLQLRELEEKYQSERKEREIALLKKDQELQRLAWSRQRANTTFVVFALASVVVIGGLLINRYRVNNRIQRQLALEKMRQDISRDLHDDIGSALSSIHIMSTLAMQEQRDSVHLQRIASTSRHILETMSDIVWSINPNHDSLEQLLFKMKEFAGEILDAKNMAYSFEEKMEGESKHLLLNATVRRNIFLVFKEAVNNAAKYSEGNNLKIAAWIEGKNLNFKIEDDGKGFVRGSIKTGNGLKNMEARANELSAVFRQESSPGNGTKVFLSVPIP